MQPWRRALIEHGLTLEWLASRTGRSVAAVKAYSAGVRKAPIEWIEKAESVIEDYERGNAA